MPIRQCVLLHITKIKSTRIWALLQIFAKREVRYHAMDKQMTQTSPTLYKNLSIEEEVSSLTWSLIGINAGSGRQRPVAADTRL